ncbi:hypothetical protein CR513_35605, partial [Mucuna pruriens]
MGNFFANIDEEAKYKWEKVGGVGKEKEVSNNSQKEKTLTIESSTEKKRKVRFLNIFKELHINIPFIEAIIDVQVCKILKGYNF